MFDSVAPGDIVVAVVAHPDDAEMMFYGILRGMRARGARVVVLLVTHGERGVSIRDANDGGAIADGERLGEVTAAYLGTDIELRALGRPDGSLYLENDLVTAIESELLDIQPTIVLTHSPRAGSDHQDHHAVGVATTNALNRVASCRRLYFGQPHRPGARFRPNLLVRIDEYIEDKIIALEAHQSQGDRWYLSAEYTRARALDLGWKYRPAQSRGEYYFEALECELAVEEP